MTKRIIETIMNTLVIFVISTVCNAFFLSTYNPDLSITIGDVQKIEKLSRDQYIIQINIKNNTDRVINNTLIQIPTEVIKDNIYSSNSITIVPLENNDSKLKSTSLRFDDILGNQITTITLLANSEFDSSKVLASSKDKKINVKYYTDKNNELYRFLVLAITAAFITAFAYGVQFYFIESRQEKRNLENEERVKSLKQDLERYLKEYQLHTEELNISENRNTELGEKLHKIRVEMKKEEFLLRSRIREYDKELNFWRDTIRKMLYNSRTDKLADYDVIKIVTESLGTHRTKCIDKVCFENIEAMSELIKDREF